MPYQNIFIIAQNSPSTFNFETFLNVITTIGTTVLATVGILGYRTAITWKDDISVKKVQNKVLSKLKILKTNLFFIKTQVESSNNQLFITATCKQYQDSTLDKTLTAWINMKNLIEENPIFFNSKIEKLIEENNLGTNIQKIFTIFINLSALFDKNNQELNDEIKAKITECLNQLDIVINKLKEFDNQIRCNIKTNK